MESEAPTEQSQLGLCWHRVLTALQTRMWPRDRQRSPALAGKLAHAQPRASRLVWAALGPLSIYTNSLTVSGTADVSEGGTVHRVFHMKIFKQKELKKIPV